MTSNPRQKAGSIYSSQQLNASRFDYDIVHLQQEQETTARVTIGDSTKYSISMSNEVNL